MAVLVEDDDKTGGPKSSEQVWNQQKQMFSWHRAEGKGQLGLR